MLKQLADSAALAGPMALMCASVVVAGRVRSSRRRERLNRALHELRRPLQALTLARSAPAEPEHGQLDLALAALCDLDREINGAARVAQRHPVDAFALAEQAVGRWRGVAARSGRRIELAWRANGTQVVCAPAAIARALDNLIANSLEHGAGPIRVEAAVRDGRLRLLVADGSDAGSAVAGGSPAVNERPLRRPRDPRRGHGLRVVADVAAAHGGRFAACRHAAGATAVLELPLA